MKTDPSVLQRCPALWRVSWMREPDTKMDVLLPLSLLMPPRRQSRPVSSPYLLVTSLTCSHLCCFSRLGLPDRASALGLTRAFLDFDGSEESWRRYDKITAREVRCLSGITLDSGSPLKISTVQSLSQTERSAET